MENMGCFNQGGSMINDARYTHEVKSWFAVAKAVLKKKRRRRLISAANGPHI
jgi:hypothetical protein